MKASELVPGDVIVVAGERLRVTALPRVQQNTAVVDTVSATEAVTVYLRAMGTVSLVEPSPARALTAGPSPATLAAVPGTRVRPRVRRAAR